MLNATQKMLQHNKFQTETFGDIAASFIAFYGEENVSLQI